MNFDNIDYLKYGTARQQQLYSLLSSHNILADLKKYEPIVTGTIPINIDIESSDIDIICYFRDRSEFIIDLTKLFSEQPDFSLDNSSEDFVVVNFVLSGSEIEIFGQDIPTKKQLAYRHMIIEYNLLNQKGEAFRQKIIELKKQGYKTEPSFAKVLGLSGDPFIELLKFED